MSKRPYYTCPIKAALMMRYHGIKLYLEAHLPMINYNTNEKFREVRQFPIDTWETIDIKLTGINLYIHPDSLHLLEPRVDDAILIGDDLLFWVCDDDSFWEEHKDDPNLKYNFMGVERARCFVDDGATIILRNNQPFIMPEVEG